MMDAAETELSTEGTELIECTEENNKGGKIEEAGVFDGTKKKKHDNTEDNGDCIQKKKPRNEKDSVESNSMNNKTKDCTVELESEDEEDLEPLQNVRIKLIEEKKEQSKKNKMESDVPGSSCKKVKCPDKMEIFVENLVQSKTQLKAVMSDDFSNPIPTTKVYVAQVKYVQDLSKIIVILNQKLPLKELSHLKRAFRREVILFPAERLSSQTHASIQAYLEENVCELTDSFEYFKLSDVPAFPPKIRKQYHECGKSWSCNFHPDKYLEQMYADEMFTEDEIEKHRLFMGMAFQVAMFYMRKEKEELEPNDILLSDLNATVVVDPSTKSVVAVAFDNRANHPVQHSTMLAIDNVAKTQNGGAWNTFDIETNKLRGIGYMDLLLHLKHKYPDVKFGAKKYVGKSYLDENKLDPADSPYLCTGYYIYMIKEPCIMCAMGLVHARINRVFFSAKSSKGALTSLTKLHTLPSLNHHFEVFTDFL